MVADSATLLIADAGRAQSPTHGGALLSPGDLLPDWVLADLRTDHAGELGAVCIYQGVLRFARDPALQAFAQHHLNTEQKHLRLIEAWLPKAHYSRLLPVWRLAGLLTGALPALFGTRAHNGAPNPQNHTRSIRASSGCSLVPVCHFVGLAIEQGFP